MPDHPVNEECLRRFGSIEKTVSSASKERSEIKSSVDKLTSTVEDCMRSVKRLTEGNGKEPLIVRLDRLEQFDYEQRVFRDEVKKSIIANVGRAVISFIIFLIVTGAFTIFVMNTAKFDKDDVKKIVQEVQHETTHSAPVAASP